MYWENLRWLRLGDRYTACRPRGSLHHRPPPPHQLPGRGGVRWKVTQPSWTPAPVRRRASNITAWGGEFGEEGEGRGVQVAISSGPLEGALHASREGPRPPGAENLRPSTRETFVLSERWGGGLEERRKGGDTGKLQLPQLVPDRSWFQPRRMEPRWFAKRTLTQSAHTEPDSVVTSCGLLGAKRVGVGEESLKRQPQDSAKDIDTPLWTVSPLQCI